jgi:hypothetical protein
MTTFPPELPDPKGLSETKRDLAVEQALVHGALAPHLLEYLPVAVWKDGVELTLFVSPDYIGAGRGDQFLRTPLPAVSLQRVADAHGAVLPTARMVYLIYKSQTAVRIAFKGLSPQPGETRHSTRLWLESNAFVEARRAGRTGLLVGHKKDVVVGPTQMARPTKVAIFGAWGTDGKMIQDLNVTSHSLGYCDYSQCGRLVRPVVLLNGVEWDMADVFRHPTYRLLLTGESGPLSGVPRYPV